MDAINPTEVTATLSTRPSISAVIRLLILCLGALSGVGCRQGGSDSEQAGPQSGHANRDEFPTSRETPDSLDEAIRAFSIGDLDAAQRLTRNHLVKNPSNLRGLELAGDIAFRRKQFKTSIEFYDSAIDASPTPPFRLLEKQTKSLAKGGYPFEVLGLLKQMLNSNSDQTKTHYDLAGLATMVGLPGEAVASLQWLARHNRGEPDSLLVLADPGSVNPDRMMCEEWLRRAAGDSRQRSESQEAELRPGYGLAVLDARELNWSSVVERLRPMIETHPDFIPAHALYGRALIELRDFDQFAWWNERTPIGVTASPAHWIVTGLWAQENQQHDAAARAFWQALRLDELSHWRVLANLRHNLARTNRQKALEIASERLTKYGAMRDALKTFIERGSRSQAACMKVADAFVDLGRIWEAEAWARLAASLSDDLLADIAQQYLAIRSPLQVETPWQLTGTSIGARIDLSGLPLVDWEHEDLPEQAPRGLVGGEFRFQDEAEQRGLAHTCKVAANAQDDGLWIYHTVGGGVGVIDLDLDGWPDLTAATLDGQPRDSNSAHNGMFRNLEGELVDVATNAGYLDTGFSHGIAIGDYNDDGFADVYDANNGRNRLFRNNGDGTFQDVSDEAGLDGIAWTTSVAVADIDGDGFADLYDVNYCDGDMPYEMRCKNSRGTSSCNPLTFKAQPDSVWRGQGDGTFVDASALWMSQTTPGRGLGVLAGRFDERPGFDLYVANDMTVNHFWSGETENVSKATSSEPATSSFRLRDLGVVRGLGFSGKSQSQASMGMAAGDPDQDGDIDFFLTHFSHDHNTFYEQVAPGIWADRSFQMGFAEVSMKLLGFGTQWCDLDNNGSLELMVTNGNVHNSDDGIAFEMPPQLFHQRANDRWTPYDPAQLGDYFQQDHLGRALATLDINLDGRFDFAITHLFEPISLLVNKTEGSGGSIGFELKSTVGQRDAIGARVRLSINGREIVSQLSAGDGYLSSNERKIHVGTGAASKVTDVTVEWASGKTESFGELKCGIGYLLVEGTGAAQWMVAYSD